LHLETRSRKRAHIGDRERAGALIKWAGAQLLFPLGPDFLCYGKYPYGNLNNPSDGKFRTHIDGSNPNKPLEALFDPYINRPLTSVSNTNSPKPSLILLQLELV